MQGDKLKNVKEVIDAEAYTGGILKRAQEAALSDDDKKVLEKIKIASRRKKKCKKNGRK
jgi:uncharacterized protein YqgV (UPF0045/DUF77 family)